MQRRYDHETPITNSVVLPLIFLPPLYTIMQAENFCSTEERLTRANVLAQNHCSPQIQCRSFVDIYSKMLYMTLEMLLCLLDEETPVKIAIIEPSGAVLNMLLYAVKLINEYDVQGFIHPPEDLTPYDCVVIEPGQYKRWLPAIYDHVQRRGKHAIVLTQYYECMSTGLPTIRKQTVFIAPLLAKLEEIAQQVKPIPI